jgi:hypothetical protein
MMTIRTGAILAFAATLTVGACNRAAESPLDHDTTASVTVPTGTGGQASAADQPEQASDLPGTASPLALAGIMGIVSLAGAAVVRTLRRR